MIYGDRIRLRAIEREDVPNFVRWLNDPEVRRFLLFHRPLSRMDEERWVENLVNRKDDVMFTYEALIGEEWVHLGNVGLEDVDWKNRKATFGIFLGEKAYWGQGYGTDVARTVLRFAFHELNLNRVELEVYEFNPRAIRAYEKAGFRREGTRRQALYREGRYWDVYWMGVLKEEFEEGI